MNSNSSIKNTINISKNSLLTSICANIPFFVQFYIIITLILYTLNHFIKDTSYLLSNVPSKIIYQSQIWRLITSGFMTTNLCKIILGFLSWTKFACSLENAMGTLKYMIIFTINSFFIQILYCILHYFSSFITFKKASNIILNKDNNNIDTENNGMWGIIICELTLLCLNNPQSQIKILFFPCKIKIKYYPIIFCLLLSLFDSFKIDLQIISGVIYGVIYFYFLKSKIIISDSFINNIEEKYCFTFITKYKKYKTNKKIITNNMIISNDRGSYSPVQIASSSNFNNNINDLENNNSNSNNEGMEHNSD